MESNGFVLDLPDCHRISKILLWNRNYLLYNLRHDDIIRHDKVKDLQRSVQYY